MLFPWWWSALSLPPPPCEGWRWWHDLLITLRNYRSSPNRLWQWQRLTVEETHDIPAWFLTAGTCAEEQISVWFTCTEKSEADREAGERCISRTRADYYRKTLAMLSSGVFVYLQVEIQQYSDLSSCKIEVCGLKFSTQASRLQLSVLKPFPLSTAAAPGMKLEQKHGTNPRSVSRC